VVTVVFRTKGIYVITSTFFFTFFQNPKVATFNVFLPCFVRFLELCCDCDVLSGSREVESDEGS